MASISVKDLETGIVVMQLSGHLKMGKECQELKAVVDGWLEKNRTKVVLDLSSLRDIDSAGIGAVALSFSKARSAGGGLAVAGARPGIVEVFNLTRVGGIVPLLPDVPSATAALMGDKAVHN